MMKAFVIGFCMAVLIGCHPAPTHQLLPVPYSENPETPAQALLDSLSTLTIQVLDTTWIQLENQTEKIRWYTYHDVPFSGWVKEDFSTSHGRIRYYQIDSGMVNWQVGYFTNGHLDCDFHQLNGENHGSQRMWSKDGTPYISTYAQHGKQHGKQRRWYPNGQLEWLAVYEQGELVEEVYYSEAGKIQRFQGDFEVPYLDSSNFDQIKPIYSQGWGNVYRYFIYYFDSTAVKEPLDHRGGNYCHFKQQFAQKIELEMKQCNAGESAVIITLPKMSVSHAKKIVRGFFQNETAEMVNMRNAAVPFLWSNDTLHYSEEGISGAAGCDFHFESTDTNMVIRFYCTD